MHIPNRDACCPWASPWAAPVGRIWVLLPAQVVVCSGILALLMQVASLCGGDARY